MELACKLGGQNGVNTDVVVTDFEGFLKRREEAYAMSQITKDPTFETCRCTSAADVPLVKEKILAKFEDIAAFNATIKNIADVILKKKRDYLIYDPGPDGNCKICGHNEGDHHHNSNGNKYCKDLDLQPTFVKFWDDGTCQFCGAKERHHIGKQRYCQGNWLENWFRLNHSFLASYTDKVSGVDFGYPTTVPTSGLVSSRRQLGRVEAWGLFLVTICEKFSGVALGFPSAPWSFSVDPTICSSSERHMQPARFSAQRAGARRSGPSGAYTAACSPYREGVGSVVLRAYGGCYALSDGSSESS